MQIVCEQIQTQKNLLDRLHDQNHLKQMQRQRELKPINENFKGIID